MEEGGLCLILLPGPTIGVGVVEEGDLCLVLLPGPTIEVGVVEEGGLCLVLFHPRLDCSHNVHVSQAGDLNNNIHNLNIKLL